MRVSFFISKNNFAHIYQRIAHTEVLFTHIYQQIAYTDEKNAVSDDVNHHIIIDLEYAQSNFS